MGDGRPTAASFPSASKCTFFFCTNNWPIESGSSWPGPPSKTLTSGVVWTGWDISHCPTIFVLSTLADGQHEMHETHVPEGTYQFYGDGDSVVGDYYGQDICLLNVSLSQRRIDIDRPGCELSKRTRRWRRAASGRNPVPRPKNSFQCWMVWYIIWVSRVDLNGVHLPFTNEKFLWARLSSSLSKYTRNPDNEGVGKVYTLVFAGGLTSYHLFAVAWDPCPKAATTLYDISPFLSGIFL